MIRSTKEKLKINPHHFDATKAMPHEENLFFDYYLRQNRNNKCLNKDARKFENGLFEFVKKMKEGKFNINGVEDQI